MNWAKRESDTEDVAHGVRCQGGFFSWRSGTDATSAGWVWRQDRMIEGVEVWYLGEVRK